MSNLKRKIVRGIAVDSYTSLSDMELEGCKIERVWTILHEERLYEADQFDTQTGKKIEHPIPRTLETAILRHGYNVFLEDRIHDWNIYDEKFKYYTRIVARGEKCDLLIEYTLKK